MHFILWLQYGLGGLLLQVLSTGATLKVATSTIFDSDFLQQVHDNNQNIRVNLVDLNTEQYLNYIMSSSTEVDVFSVDIVCWSCS